MVDRVKVTENSKRSNKRTQEEIFEISLWNAEAFFLADQDDQGEEKCHKITEETFLEAGKIPGKPDKGIHKCKTKGRTQNIDNTAVFGVDFYFHYFTLSL